MEGWLSRFKPVKGGRARQPFKVKVVENVSVIGHHTHHATNASLGYSSGSVMERNEEKWNSIITDSEPPAFARMRLHTKLGAKEGYIETVF
jgi:hypothetical protein